MQQKEILKQNLLINLKKCFNNSQIVFYYVPKISHKFGEYLCTVNLSTNEELNFTDIGLVYKYKSQEKFIKYSEIGDVFIYSSDRIGIVSEDKLQLIILTNIKAKVLKETLDTIILSTWESNNFSKENINIKVNDTFSLDEICTKWNRKIEASIINLKKIKTNFENLKRENYFNGLSKEISEIIEKINNYSLKINNPTYNIAVVGAIKAGKSSLINAILGEEIVSVDVTPETATLTKFKYSEKNSLKITFYEKYEWDRIWKEINLEKEKEQGKNYLRDYQELKADQIKNQYLNKLPIQLEFKNIPEIKEEIKKWTSSKQREHFFVKEIEIGLNTLNLPEQVCLVDTPGLNDVSKYRSDITKRYIDEVNAVLICINCKTLRNEEYLVINDIYSRKNKFKDKIYILGTQIDIFNKIQIDWKKQKESWLKDLAEIYESKNILSEHIIGVTSKLYVNSKKLLGKFIKEDIDSFGKVLNDDEDYYLTDVIRGIDRYDNIKIEKIRKKIIEASNIEYLKKNIISQKLLFDWNNDLERKFLQEYELILQEINSFIKKNSSNLEENISLLKKKTQEKENELKDKQKNLKNILEIKTYLKNKIVQMEEDNKKEFSKFNSEISKVNNEILKKFN